MPKSVSAVWSQAPAHIRSIIENAVREAVQSGIAYLQTIGVVSRTGADGIFREEVKLLFAAFEHSTSRAQDPQLHIHTILINLGLRADGTTGTLDPREVYRHQLAAGALFRAELAARLERELGLRARRVKRCFEIIGVATTLIDEFSKRRAQIEARLFEIGAFSPAAAETAALDTREKKKVFSREELLPRWQEVGRNFNWSEKELGWLLNTEFPTRDLVRETEQARTASLKALTKSYSNFSARQLVQALAEEAQGRGLDANKVLELHAKLLQSRDLVPLKSIANERRWTTPEMLALEKHALSVALAMNQAERFSPSADTLVADSVRRHHPGPGMTLEEVVTTLERFGIKPPNDLLKALRDEARQYGAESLIMTASGRTSSRNVFMTAPKNYHVLGWERSV